MAGKSSDIELIAGLKGGGSIHGTSGKRIQDQVNSILQHVKVKPIDVELRLDPGSVNKFKSELESITRKARNEAAQIAAAYQSAIPPSPYKKWKPSNNPFTEMIQYNNALGRCEDMLRRVRNAQEKWSSAANNGLFKQDVVDEYAKLDGYESRLNDLITAMLTNKSTLADALKTISEINKEFKRTNTIIDNADADFNSGDVNKRLTQARKTADAMRSNLDKWSAAKNGASKSSFSDYEKILDNEIDVLIERLEQRKITLEDFNESFADAVDRAGKAEHEIFLAGEKRTVAKENQEYIKQLEKINTLTDEYKKNLRDWSAAKFGGSSSEYAGIEKLIADLDSLKLKLTQSGAALDNFEQDISEIEISASKLGATIKSNGNAYKTFGDKTFGMVTEMFDYIDAMDVVFEVFNQSKQMISNVTEIDTAMTELRKVTEETEASYSAFLDKASVRAREFGSTVSAVVSASADFARLGHDLEGASALADAAIVYQNVGDGINDIETASSSIISTMQAFGIEAENAMSIVDKFNAVGNNYAISSSGIGEALLNSAASLHAAGNNIDESVALIAAANTTIQDPGKVGKCLPNNAVMY